MNQLAPLSELPDMHPAPGVTSDDAEIMVPPGLILTTATDGRGILRYVSPQLCAISGLSAPQLLGTQHRSLGHSDTPRGVYHLYWQRLRDGYPACAYVKYKAANSRFYWAFTVAMATDDGFMSWRLRPETVHLAMIQDLYRDMCDRESQGLSSQQSADHFVACLAKAGFADYDLFMHQALADESKKRSHAGQTPSSDVDHLSELIDLLNTAERLSEQVSRDFNKVRSEPVNMRIMAGRIEGASGALGTISQNYDIMASEMHQLVERLRDPQKGTLGRMRKAVQHGRFQSQITALLAEYSDQTESNACAIQADMIERLRKSTLDYTSEAKLASRWIPDICRQLRHRINGLNVVKLLCRVESGRIQNADGGLEGIIERLETFHQTTEINLAMLSAKADQIRTTSAAL
ncbi:hypothetical protein [Phaeobacter sp. J2-8]|uniref:hypothetical protein n=1 Tax=Phaeobacter sp. J2-8 TaxID=2931394 RepID=UPI001FD0847A|nr:hypothetical protein [Phaeobacter sp. J2-8]MCJ7872003.1 hypothetical protein [Phaeobacter sp. J2-8]